MRELSDIHRSLCPAAGYQMLVEREPTPRYKDVDERLCRAMTYRNHIRELFLHPKGAYGREDVRRLTDVSERGLKSAIADGSVVVQEDASFTWEEVVMLGFREWTPRIVAAALGDEAAQVLPPLNQHRSIRISLPFYLIRMLQYLATAEQHRTRRNASDVVEECLLGMACSLDIDAIEEAIPGFGRAMNYPADAMIEEPCGTIAIASSRSSRMSG